MAFATGVLSAPATTGNFSVTGLSFQPKYVRFFAVEQTDGGLAGDAVMMEGATDGTRQWAHACRSQDNAATTVTVAGRTDLVCVSIPSLTATPLFEAAVVSLNSDGFTLNATVVDGATHPVAWYAEGGPEVIAVRVDTFDTGAVTGTLSITTPGFRPSIVHLALGRAVAAATDGHAVASGVFSQGAFNDQGEQYATALVMDSAAAAAADAHMGSSAACLMALTTAAGALGCHATYRSMDPSGFTLNFVINAASRGVGYIAIQRAGRTRIGKFTASSVLGAQSIAGLPMMVEQVFLTATRATDTTSTPGTGSAYLSVGHMGPASQFVLGLGSVNAADPAQCGAFLTTGKALRFINAATPSTIMEHGRLALDVERFELDCTTTDGSTTRVVFFIALGPAPSRPPFAQHPKPIIRNLIARTGRA